MEQFEVTSLQHNLPPRIGTFAVLGAGIVFKAPVGNPEPDTTSVPAAEDLFTQNLPEMPETPPFPSAPRFDFRRGLRTLTWTAEDPNGDRLAYRLEYRSRNRAAGPYTRLKDDLKDNWYTFDSTSLPDGDYQVRLTVSDHLSNAPGEDLQTTRQTRTFVVDNTPPVVQLSRDGDILRATATDDSGLHRAYVSTDGGDWIPARPEDGITDGVRESFSFPIAGLSASQGGSSGTKLVLFKVFDALGNVGAASVDLGGIESR